MQDRKEAEIFTAVREKYIAGIKRLIVGGVDLTVVNSESLTPIQLAASLDQWECVEAIAKNRKTDEKDAARYGEALLLAMKASRPTAEIKLLVDSGASLTALISLDDYKYTAIQYARSLEKWDWIEIIAASRKDNNDSAKFGDPMVIAMSTDKLTIAKSLLDAGAATTWYTTSDHDRPLHWAVKKRNIEMIEALLKHKASISIENKNKQTPIQLAAALGYWECVETIAKHKKTDDEDTGKYGDVLLSAIKANRPAAEIKVLADADADLTMVNADNKTAIQLARSLGQWESIETIAKSRKSDAGDRANYGEALVMAMNSDRFALATCLLEAGAKTYWTTLSDGNTPLHWAVKKNNIAMIKLLLQKGANLASENQDKYTPIQLAAELGHWECVAAIAQMKNADDNDTGRYGDAVRRAVMSDKVEIVDSLLKAKSPVSWYTINTENKCLHEAVRKKNPKMVSLLLKYNADPLRTNKEGQTPIEYACALGHWECAEEFALDKKFSFKDSAKAGIAFIQAVRAGCFDLASYLQSAGASISERLEGFNALHWAVQDKNPKAIQFLLGKSLDQTALSKSEKTAIELACETAAWDCAQTLLECGNNDFNDKKRLADLHYENALLSAIKNNNYAIAKLLLEHNAPCARWNSETGNIALFHVINTKGSNPDMISLLLQHGADPDIKNKSGQTSLDLAKKLGREDCVKRLQNRHGRKKTFDIASLVQEASDLYESLVENQVRSKNIAGTLSKLEKCHRDIFDNDLYELKTRRDAIKNNLPTHSEYLAQAMNPNSELGEICQLISILQGIDTVPVNPAQLVFLGHNTSASARHILEYLDHKQKVDEFSDKINTQLDQLQTKITSTKWQIKNLMGEWTLGTPAHIELIKKELLKRSGASSRAINFSVFYEIKSILAAIAESDRRHPDTIAFYQSQLKAMNTTRFFTPVSSNAMTYSLQASVPQLEAAASLYPVLQPGYQHYAVPLYPLVASYASQAIPTAPAWPQASFASDVPVPASYQPIYPPTYQASVQAFPDSLPAPIQPTTVSAAPTVQSVAPAAVSADVQIKDNQDKADDILSQKFPEVPTHLLRTSQSGLFSETAKVKKPVETKKLMEAPMLA